MKRKGRDKTDRTNERKERIPTVVLGDLTEDLTIVLGVPIDGVVPLLDGKTGKPIGEHILQTGISYGRSNKGPKILTLRAEHASRVEADPNRRLLDFDHIFAIDTNTDPATGRSVTVAAGIRNLTLDAGKSTFTIGFLPALVWCSPVPSPERTGWHAAISMIIRNADFAGRVALFVDSELSRLQAINARKEPILGEFLLPPDYQLVYAASDRAMTEYVGNFAMSRCDRVATRVMKLTADRTHPDGWFPLVITDEMVDD